jgi:hypothetical protein
MTICIIAVANSNANSSFQFSIVEAVGITAAAAATVFGLSGGELGLAIVLPLHYVVVLKLKKERRHLIST